MSNKSDKKMETNMHIFEQKISKFVREKSNRILRQKVFMHFTRSTYLVHIISMIYAARTTFTNQYV